MPPALDSALDDLPHGERQLANLARACLGAPEVLLLDEALSALDTPTERHLLTQIPRRLPGTATLVVLHRRANLDTVAATITLGPDPTAARAAARSRLVSAPDDGR